VFFTLATILIKVNFLMLSIYW